MTVQGNGFLSLILFLFINYLKNAKLKFPLTHRIKMRAHHPRFTTRRPTTTY